MEVKEQRNQQQQEKQDAPTEQCELPIHHEIARMHAQRGVNVLQLIILRDLVTRMAGIDTLEDLSNEQLQKPEEVDEDAEAKKVVDIEAAEDVLGVVDEAAIGDMTVACVVRELAHAFCRERLLMDIAARFTICRQQVCHEDGHK